MIEGFGLNLEGKVIQWFQTLNPSNYYNFEVFKQEFIASFSKMGMKHDELSRINGFKQDKDESVHDCEVCLKQYISRCPSEEVLSQERLVLIFLEGLLYKDMYTALYMKHHY